MTMQCQSMAMHLRNVESKAMHGWEISQQQGYALPSIVNPLFFEAIRWE